MADVTINVTTIGEYGQYAEIGIIADGVEVGGGSVGGEAEDNTIGRDYAWIVPAMKALAERLGAKVEVTEAHRADDDEDDIG